MGFFSDTTTSTTSYPEKLEKLTDRSMEGLEDWRYKVTDRNKYQDYTGNLLSSLYNKEPGQNIAKIGRNSYNTAIGLMSGDGMSLADRLGRAEAAYSLDNIMGYARPLEDALNKRSAEQIRQQYRTSGADIDNSLAASAGFSGASSEAALRKALLDKSAVEAGRDASLANEASALQLGSSLASGEAGLKASNAAQIANNDLSALQSGYSMGTGGISLGRNLDMSLAGMLDQYGNEIQRYDQSKLDEPYTEFSLYSPFVSSTTSGSSTPSGSSILGGGLNLLGGIGSLFGLF